MQDKKEEESMETKIKRQSELSRNQNELAEKSKIVFEDLLVREKKTIDSIRAEIVKLLKGEQLESLKLQSLNEFVIPLKEEVEETVIKGILEKSLEKAISFQEYMQTTASQYSLNEKN